VDRVSPWGANVGGCAILRGVVVRMSPAELFMIGETGEPTIFAPLVVGVSVG
jgi:hypothetical protein